MGRHIKAPNMTESKEAGARSRNESIEVGTTVTLLCTNVKIPWSKMFYLIWKINSHKSCRISVVTNDTSFTTCEDEKKMYISTAGDYSLIIPDFSIKDEGIYTCDVSYRAGGYVETIHVSAWARPNLTGWLEDEGGPTFAVCEAQSKPAASIYWKTQWNPSEPKTNSSKNASGLFTVTSRLQLPQNASHNNLTCMVSASPHKWKEIPFNSFKFKGSRNESIEVGTTVTLLCTNVKIPWSEMIYVIWKINSHKNCWISVATNDTSFNTCEDEKKMYISTAGDYSLIIPDFSIKDEGNYTCDVSYRAGGYVETIHVSAWARPSLTGWLEDIGGHTFAICEAQSKPVASIYWKTQWNTSEPKTNSSKDASGLFTVTSCLQLPQNASRNNLTCVVSASPHKWKEIPFNTFKYKASDKVAKHYYYTGPTLLNVRGP
ncbi:CD276 antigen-like [Salminus brasiliensis]|uniref:CD276 antigen-like n=1 Tax=Salminus brasiliensis TaxID=930266 RepID=UPI003B83896D